MRRPALLRRRVLWVPTLAGWALLVALAAVLVVACARGLYPFLAPDAPRGHGALVVEGWCGELAFATAVRAWNEGRYERVFTTGGPIEHTAWQGGHATWAEVAAARLHELGLPVDRIVAVPAPASAQDRSFLAAVELRDRLARTGAPPAIDVLSQGPHARRSRHLYELAFDGAVPIGIRAAPPEDYDPARWWGTSAGTRDVVGEALAYAWTACCFRPPPPGSHDERWGRPEQLPPSRRR